MRNASCVWRWLLAGHSDQNWPVHRRRSHHVELGGKGLQDFAQGMSEEAMDALVASWFWSSLSHLTALSFTVQVFAATACHNLFPETFYYFYRCLTYVYVCLFMETNETKMQLYQKMLRTFQKKFQFHRESFWKKFRREIVEISFCVYIESVEKSSCFVEKIRWKLLLEIGNFFLKLFIIYHIFF